MPGQGSQRVRKVEMRSDQCSEGGYEEGEFLASPSRSALQTV